MSCQSTCHIEDDVKKAVSAFRSSKSQKNAALIIKINRQKQTICLDDKVIENTPIEELQKIIPSHEPRYIVYRYKMEHDDGRTSFPMCFIFYTPRDIQVELQVLYASMTCPLQNEVDLTRYYEVRELEELTEEWLKGKLAR